MIRSAKTCVIAVCILLSLSAHAADKRKRAAAKHAASPAKAAQIERFACAGDNENAWWLTLTAERKIIEWLAHAGVTVYSEFTAKQPAVSPPCRIAGAVSYKDSTATLKVTLARKGRTAGEMSMAVHESKLRPLRNVLGEIIVYGLDIDRQTVKQKNSKNRPTHSAYAFGLYLLAKRALRADRPDKAIALLEDAVRADSLFAMACWTIGRIYHDQNKRKLSRQWLSRAKSIDEKHPQWPYADTVVNEHPLDSLLHKSRSIKFQSAGAGLSYKNVFVPAFNLNAVIWRINTQKYSIAICMQADQRGNLIPALHSRCNALISLNAGFFEIDRSYHLFPSGLVVRNSKQVAGYCPKGGSGIFYMKNDTAGIMWSRDYDSTMQFTIALQCGPVIVEPGSKPGVYSNNFKRVNRSAVGISSGKNEVVLVAAATPNCRALSLYEFAEFLRADTDSGGCGCDVALNLDGGSSTQLQARIGKIKHDIKGLWPVNNALVVKKR